MSLKKRALTGVFWSAMQQFSSQVVSFIMSIILARLLLPKEFGLIAMIGIFIGIGTALLNAGLGQSLIRTENPSQKEYSTVFFFNLIGSVIIYIIIFFLAPLIAQFYNQDILETLIRWYALTIIINAFYAIQNTRLIKIMDFKTQMKVTLPSIIISGSVGVFLAYKGYGVWSLVVMAIVQSTVNAIQLWFYTKWRPSIVFDKKAFYYHFNYGYKLTIAGVLNTLFANAYTIIIGKFFAAHQVGFYIRADGLKQIPVKNISAIINKVTFPLFAEIKDDDIRLKNIYKRIMQLIIFLIAPILLILSALAEPLFRFLYTETWLPAVPYFQILCFNGILFPIHSYNLNVIKVKGRSDLVLFLGIIKKVLIIITVLITFKFGIIGLLYGTVFNSVLAFYINAYYTGKFLKYTSIEQLKDILPSIILAGICAIIVCFSDIFICNYFTHDLIRLLFGGAIGGGLYISLAYFFKMSSLNELMIIIRRK